MRGHYCVLGALALAGCNQILGIGDLKTGSTSDASIDAMPEGPMPDCPQPPSDGINGCANITHILLDGTTPVTRGDLSGFNVTAYVPDSSMTSGFKMVPGTAAADGTITIHGIDPGVSYWLRLQNPTDPTYPYPHYFYTSQRTLDLGYYEIGRDTTPATGQTDITFNLSGLAPWALNEGILAQSFNAGTGEGPTPMPDPTVGATTYTGLQNWASGTGEATWSDITDELARKPQLVDTTKGDDFWITQSLKKKLDITLSDSVIIITTILDAVKASPVTMVNGTAQTITATLAAVPPTTTVQTLNFNYDAVRGAFKDTGGYVNEDFNCTRSANLGADLGLTMSTIWNFDTTPTGWQHGVTWMIPYTNPFPTTWPQVISCSYLHLSGYKPNAATKNLNGASYVVAFLPATDTFTFTPTIHGATNIKIGGVNALVGGSVPFDGVKPVTMSWDPQPSVTHYQVRVIGAVEGVVAVFDTADTSIVMPPDTFTKGNFYILRVFAIQQSVNYADGHLLRFSAPIWYVRTATAAFRFSSDCGNGTVNTGEDCDPGTPNTSTATCDADCTKNSCGDGFTNTAAGEMCDTRGDSSICDADCTPVMCGDGYWNALMEECDDGPMNGTAGDDCSAQCKLVKCGDGVVEANEGCDDGNRKSGDGCSSTCQLECGDGVIDPPLEQCDDSFLNGTPGDHCSATCMKI
jgi:cysteine-rich repeat protein